MSKNRIIPQMYDVRPVDETGDLDWKKISAVGLGKNNEPEFVEKIEKDFPAFSAKAYYLGVPVNSQAAPIFHDEQFNLRDAIFENSQQENEQHQKQEALIREQEQLRQRQEEIFRRQEVALQQQEQLRQLQIEKEQRAFEKKQALEKEILAMEERRREIAEQEKSERKWQETEQLAERESRELEKVRWLEMEAQSRQFLQSAQKAKKVKLAKRAGKNRAWSAFVSAKKASFKRAIFAYRYGFGFGWQKFVPAFAMIALVLLLGIGGVSFASKGFGLQGKVLGVSQDGYANLTQAIADMKAQNFEASGQQFDQAFDKFSQASNDLEDLGGGLLDATRFFPFTSKVSSGKNAVEAGKHFAAAGQSLNEVVKTFAQLKQSGQLLQGNVSLLEIFRKTENNITAAKTELDAAQKNMDLIALADLPADKQQKFLLLKESLPQLRLMMENFLSSSHIFVELLGGNGPRKYLFLFQNNSEMRATGGFIGSYGLLDIANGHVKKFFIDGIFNPDGQLKEKIVPPFPIQKISTAWSLHDSNWFPDFPLSARKAISFYEKTGGPTADGVISLTPTLMQKLLKITGPIEMPEYGVTLDSDNFIELTQYKVEVDYDKQDNTPKKILSDLAPLLLEKLLSSKDPATISGAAQALLEGLSEKHILFYSQNKEIEDIISTQGWSGQILSTDKDYLSVINTNINGFKTDVVVDEYIAHSAQIQTDGSIVDTVKITRKHTGGNSQFEWFNKVNADYMRVYVPKGSQLLEASGQTREVDQSPVDYDALGFKRDSDVQQEESSIKLDPNSGTGIYDESGKTVFANWVYVSPGEAVTMTYKYLLPFRLFQLNVNNAQKIDSYSLVAQKQAGSLGSSFSSDLSYPQNYNVKWTLPQSLTQGNNELKNNSNLVTDYFEGVVFENSSP